jgi:hypothetical protein
MLFPFVGCVLTAAARPAAAQIVLRPVQVSSAGPGEANSEPAIIASPSNPSEVLVAWINTPSWRIQYRVSLDGFASAVNSRPSVLPFPNAPAPPCGPCGGIRQADPAVAASPLTGDLYLGATCLGGPDDLESPDGGEREGGNTGGQGVATLALARKPFGAPDLEPLAPGIPRVRYALPCLGGIPDRPALAIGPWPGGPIPPANSPEAAYVLFASGYLCTARSLPSPIAGTAWECDPAHPSGGYPSLVASGRGPAGEPALRQGWGNSGVVLASGPHRGRLIMASSGNQGRPWTALPPEVTWSDTGGGPITQSPPAWAAATPLDRFGPAGSPIAGIVDPATDQTPVPPDIRLQFKSDPGIAADPTHPGRVYIAFLGRAIAETPDQIDLFLSVCDFDAAPAASDTGTAAPIWRTHKIADSWLLAPGENPGAAQPEQFMPTLRIDALGGINLLFCQAPDIPASRTPTLYSVRYARWPSLAALEAGCAPFLSVLSSGQQPWPSTAGNDYMGLTASGRDVYAAWAGSQSGDWQVYVSRIRLFCPADLNADGVTDSRDAALFAAAYMAGDPSADLDGDGAITARDVAAFTAPCAAGLCSGP